MLASGKNKATNTTIKKLSKALGAELTDGNIRADKENALKVIMANIMYNGDMVTRDEAQQQPAVSKPTKKAKKRKPKRKAAETPPTAEPVKISEGVLEVPGFNIPSGKKELDARIKSVSKFIESDAAPFEIKEAKEYLAALKMAQKKPSGKDATLSRLESGEELAGDPGQREEDLEAYEEFKRKQGVVVYRDGKETTIDSTPENTITIEGDQAEMIKSLQDDGTIEGADEIEILPSGRVKDYREADKFIREYLSGGSRKKWEYIKYTNKNMPQKGVEYHSLKDDIFYSEEKIISEQYGKQRPAREIAKTSSEDIAGVLPPGALTVEQIEAMQEKESKTKDINEAADNISKEIDNDFCI